MFNMEFFNPKLLSKDPTHHGLTPKFSKPSENVVDLSDVGVAGSLPLTARNSEPNAILSDPSFPKPSPSFLSNLITESSDNPRTLWKTLNTILHRNPSNSLPESPDASSLANTFLDFFKDKIERIRAKFVPSDSPDPFLSPHAPPPKMTNFIPATLTEIHKLISASESKQCPLDSIPTFLLKLCFNKLGPIITNLVNLSLSEGIFPSSFKQALVQPLLKKPSLSTDDLNNFRPISNLNFISKILEKVVASRIQSHLSSNSLSSSFQSAYRIFHSTETTLLKIHNDLILAMDRGEVTSLILLELSAAFDTVDHSILLTRLQNWLGLDGLSLNWFTSYLSSRSQAVSINDSISAFSTLSCGVPQGSVLGPLLFTLYTTPLGSVISKNSLKYHLYADDTQLYISFTPTNSALCLETLTTTFTDILSWMNLNKLLLNPSKTEFLLIGTKQQRLKFCDLTNLSLSNDIIIIIIMNFYSPVSNTKCHSIGHKMRIARIKIRVDSQGRWEGA